LTRFQTTCGDMVTSGCLSPTRRLFQMRTFAAILWAAFQCSNSFAAEFELKVGHNGEIDHPYQIGFERFKQIAELQSHGRIAVTIYPAGQLGAEDKVNAMVKSGLIAAQATSVAGGLAPFVPQIDALDYPFLFRDFSHYCHVMDGDIGLRLANQVERKLDVVFLGWGFSGVRSVWNRKRPIVEPEDLLNLKIRVIGSRVVIDTFRELGAQVVPMSFGELYNALQQGVIDGAETDDIDLMVERFYEVSRYVSLTEHLYLGAGFIFSRKVFDKLPRDLQQVVIRAGKAAVLEERIAIIEKAKQARSYLEGQGVKYNAVDRARFALATDKLYKHVESPEIATLIDQIREVP
jgi:tripartite ATP-independent transporter DctP family solute receptor